MQLTDQQVEAADQQGLDHTCGERFWVEFLALGGIINVNDQQAKALELWDFLHPGVSRFNPNYGTTLQDMETVAQHLATQYPVHFHMVAISADQIVANLDGDDQGGVTHWIDSCKAVDFGSDNYTDALIMRAAVDSGGGTVGWAVTMLNADRSQTLAKAVALLVELSVITPVSGLHWILAR